jgi:pyruvate/2-oxoglutarate/acetoin dehydrogenase E1 component
MVLNTMSYSQAAVLAVQREMEADERVVVMGARPGHIADSIQITAPAPRNASSV